MLVADPCCSDLTFLPLLPPSKHMPSQTFAATDPASSMTPTCSRSLGGTGFSAMRGQAPCMCLFQDLPSVMFANVPLAKDDHMVKSRSKVGAEERHALLLDGEEQQSHIPYRPAFGEKYCGCFYKQSTTYITHTFKNTYSPFDKDSRSSL